jgi:hypothetical protein
MREFPTPNDTKIRIVAEDHTVDSALIGFAM